MDSTILNLLAACAALLTPFMASLLWIMRQHAKDGIETRSWITERTRELIEASEKRTSKLIEASEKRTGERFTDLGRKVDRVTSSLADTRERLARIEGHLDPNIRQGDETPQDNETPAGNDKAA